MGFPDVGIVRTIDRSQRALPGDAPLEFLGHFLHRALLERISAAGEEKRACGEKKESEGLQARRILKK